MNATSTTDGIRNVSVNVGEGLNVSSVTIANVETAGIDEGSNHSGNQTDGPSLGSNVESGIDISDDKKNFTVSLDGERSVGQNDEIVVVVDGGITTTKPGKYTFSLSINGAPPQKDDYNITRKKQQ